MSRLGRAAFALFPLFLASCEADKPTAGPAVSDKAVASATASAGGLSSAAPPTSASAEPAAEAPSASAASSAAAAGSGSAAAPVAKPAIKLPNAPKGILGPGAADKVLAVGGKPIVRLIDAGAEPQARLAYAFSKGPTRPLAVSLDMLMGFKGKGMELPPTAVPRITMTLDLAPAEKNGEGDWRIDAKVREFTVEPKGDAQKKVADALRPQLSGVKGLSIAYWVTPQGSVHDVKVDLPGGLPPEADKMVQGMNQSFESMVSPLPKDPVGVGGKWQVVTRLAAQGADLLQFATFTLRSREGTKLGVDVSLKQLVASEQIKVPGMPAGVSARVRSFNSGGEGKSIIDTKDVAPDSGTLTVKSQMEIEVGQGQAAPEQNSVDSTLTLLFSRPGK